MVGAGAGAEEVKRTHHDVNPDIATLQRRIRGEDVAEREMHVCRCEGRGKRESGESDRVKPNFEID